MGGYGFYVWSAYGVTALVLVVELLALRSRRRSVLAEARLTGPTPRPIRGRRPNEAPSPPLRCGSAPACCVLGVAAALVLNAFQSNLVFFFSPTEVAANGRRRAARSASAAWSRRRA